MNATQANRLKSIFGNASASANPVATHNAARVKELDGFIFRFRAAREAGSSPTDASSGRRKPRPHGGTRQPTPRKVQVDAADYHASQVRAPRSSRATEFYQSSLLAFANALPRATASHPAAR